MYLIHIGTKVPKLNYYQQKHIWKFYYYFKLKVFSYDIIGL